MMTIKKLYEGKEYHIYAICGGNKCFVQEFIEKLNDKDKKKL